MSLFSLFFIPGNVNESCSFDGCLFVSVGRVRGGREEEKRRGGGEGEEGGGGSEPEEKVLKKS